MIRRKQEKLCGPTRLNWTQWDQTRAQALGWHVVRQGNVATFKVTPNGLLHHLNDEELFDVIHKQAEQGKKFYARAIKTIMVANLTGDFKHVAAFRQVTPRERAEDNQRSIPENWDGD